MRSPPAWVDLPEPPVAVAGGGAVRLGAFRQPPQRVPEHVSPVHILCVNTGRPTRLEQCVDGHRSSGTSRRGDASFYPAALPQSFRWRDPADFLHVYLDTGAFGIADGGTLGEVGPFRAPVALGNDPLLLELSGALLECGERRVAPDTGYFDHLAAALVARLHRRCRACGVAEDSLSRGDVGGRRGELTTHQLRRVSEHVEANLHRPLPLRELAALVHRSVPHFSRLFEAATGVAPHRYLVRRRVLRAEALLRDGSLSVARVAELGGFTDQSHLSRHFRRHFGLSPGAYRRTRSKRTG